MSHNVVDLWKDYDPRKEDLEVRMHKEWKEDDIVSRFISVKADAFKGSDARIAAYCCFPGNGREHPAFVCSHVGGHKAKRTRDHYFAAVDISWLGRPLEARLDPDNTWGTDWGKIAPSRAGTFIRMPDAKS